MRLFLKSIFLFLTSMIIVSCNNDDNAETEIDLGYDFYPIEIGYEWTYNVTAIELTISSDDTTYYQVKEIVDTTYTIGEESGYILHRMYRKDSTSAWVNDSVWSIQKNEFGVVKQENGYRYQKIEFPTELGKIWNGNKWNPFSQANYEIITLDSSLSISGTTYTNVMKIDEGTSVNLIEDKERYTLYARDIGPIKIVRKILEQQPGEKQLGTVRTYSLIEYKL